jgi:hypothetical protein
MSRLVVISIGGLLLLVTSCTASHHATVSNSAGTTGAHSSGSRPVALGASSAPPCSDDTQLYPLENADVEGGSRATVSPAAKAAVLVSLGRPDSGDSGWSVLTGMTTDRQTAWKFAPAGGPGTASGSTQPSSGDSAASPSGDTAVYMDLAADGEADVTRDGDAVYASYADRVLVGDALYELESGRLVASYPGTPLAVAPDCRVVVGTAGSLAMVGTDGISSWTTDVSDLGLTGGSGSVGVTFTGSADDQVGVYGATAAKMLSASSGQVLWEQDDLGDRNHRFYPFGLLTAGPSGLTVYDARTGAEKLAVQSTFATGWSLAPAAQVVVGCSSSDENNFGTCRFWNSDSWAETMTIAGVAGVWATANGGFMVATTAGNLQYFASAGSQHPSWTINAPTGMQPDIVDEGWSLAGSTLLAAFSDGKSAGQVDALNITTGKMLWQHPVNSAQPSLGPGVWASSSENLVLVYPSHYTTTTDLTVALNLKTGAIEWSSPQEVVGYDSDVIQVVVGNQLVGISAVTGKASWQVPAP